MLGLRIVEFEENTSFRMEVVDQTGKETIVEKIAEGAVKKYLKENTRKILVNVRENIIDRN